MTTERIDLYKYFNLPRPEKGEGYLNAYIPEETERKPNRIRPAMLVIGGGAYFYISGREKECIALQFLANSFTAFTLDYSVGPVHYPAQLLEGLMAIIYIRENADKLHIDKEHVGAIGFSAGGHLCGMLATLFDSDDAKKHLGDKVSLARPDAVVLAYPVITSGEKAHVGSFDNLCGDDKELRAKLSLENCVKENSVPAFIWTTVEDNGVPSENSLLYAASCKKHNVPFELHMFEKGYHGLSLANDEVFAINKPVQAWVGLALTWLKERGFTLTDFD